MCRDTNLPPTIALTHLPSLTPARTQSNPTTVQSSRLFFEAIQSRFPSLAQGQEKSKRALEIGCGTGLLSVHLAPLLGEYVAFDPSQGMIDVLKTKIKDMPQVKPVAELLEDPETPHLSGKPVDYAFSHLTLHHIVSSAATATKRCAVLSSHTRAPHPRSRTCLPQSNA